MKRIIKLINTLIMSIAISIVNFNGISFAAADTCTWTGAGGAIWNDSLNWTGCDNGNIPENGDSLTFPSGASNMSMNNTIVGLSVATIRIEDDGYTFGGNPFTISGAIVGAPSFGANSATFDTDLTFTAVNSNNSVLSGKTLTFNGNISLSNAGGFYWAGGGTADFYGNISGSAGSMFRTDTDSGTKIIVRGTNTFTATRVGAEANGIFECRSSSCFGDNANTIYIGGGTVAIYTSAVFSNNYQTSATTPNDSWLVGYDDISITGSGTVNDGLGISQNTSGKHLQLTSSLTLNGPASLFGVDSTAGIRVDASTSGVDGFSIGSGDHRLGSNSTYTGSNTINSGAIVTVTAQSALGDTSNGTNVLTGGMIIFDLPSDLTVSEPIQIAGGGVSSAGALVQQGTASTTLDGDITLAANSTIANNADSDLFQFAGLLTGTGDLTLKGDATNGGFEFNGSSTNNYSGTVNINAVTVTLNKSGGLGFTGDLNVVSDSVNSAMLILNNAGGNQVADDAIIDFTSDTTNDAYFGSKNPNETVGMLTGDGNLFMNAAGYGITIGGGNKSGTFSGVFTNTNTSVYKKIGTGTWNLTGSSYGGVAGQEPSFNVTAGTINWGGTDMNSNLSLASGAVLKGTGTLGYVSLNSGAEINVGNSPGCMTVDILDLTDGAIFTEEIAGSVACTSYDKTTVNSIAGLNDGTLNLSLTTTPADGTVFTIISAASVTGTFKNLADGSTVTVNGVSFRINYTSTTVTLTKLAGALTTNSSNLANTGSNIQIQIVTGVGLASLSWFLIRKTRTQNSMLLK